MSRLIDVDALKDWLEIVPLTGDGGVDINDLVEHIDLMPTEREWIPCSEAVPATEDKVLCQTLTKKGVINFVIGYHTETFGWACGMNNNVVAWMPLPEPYKED